MTGEAANQLPAEINALVATPLFIPPTMNLRGFSLYYNHGQVRNAQYGVLANVYN